MTTYVLSYTLRKPGQDYQSLYDELERLGGHRALEAVWLLNLNSTAHQVHDHFKTFVDGNDRLWVSELTTNRYYSNAYGGTNDWLAKNSPAR